MPTSPTVRRRRLAGHLRGLREASGLTIDEAAARADISRSALSRIENSTVAAKPPIVRSLTRVYNVPEANVEALVQLARDAGKRGWWQGYGDILSTELGVYIGFETEANSVRGYEPLVLPGLLQTEAYAEAVFRAFGSQTKPEDIERKVAARAERQQRLKELDLWFIVEESVLHRRVGGLPVMRPQLERLTEVSRQQNVTLQVVPLASGAHPGLDGSFSIFGFADDNDPDIGYSESPAGEIWIDKPDDLRRLSHAFDILRATALSSDASHHLIERIVEELK
ncbi:helix-turn-helix transcriptional regulator [Asanoa sp. NPDC050611]|uniref:helix-turn-helix domain-containing protein n=1 Tax=Asanoa sp. NPDC050611 TaxID=3157098 RepID=UPI0033F1335B